MAAKKRRVVKGRADNIEEVPTFASPRAPRSAFRLTSVPLEVRGMVTIENLGELPPSAALVRIKPLPDSLASDVEEARRACEELAVAVKVENVPRRSLAADTGALDGASRLLAFRMDRQGAVLAEVDSVPEEARDAVRKIVEDVAGRCL